VGGGKPLSLPTLLALNHFDGIRTPLASWPGAGHGDSFSILDYGTGRGFGTCFFLWWQQGGGLFPAAESMLAQDLSSHRQLSCLPRFLLSYWEEHL
jgi:hypothetical protein